MATIDDGRAQLLAGRAAQLKENERTAGELLRQRKLDELAVIIDRNFLGATAIWHELDLLTRAPREIPIRGKSRGR
jgi:hypothetical protein